SDASRNDARRSRCARDGCLEKRPRAERRGGSGRLGPMRRLFACAAAALGASGCVTYGQEGARIRQGMLSLRALDLRECLPVPSEVKPQGDTEIAIYRWEFTPRVEHAHPSAFDEPEDPGDPDLTRERRRFLESGERPRHMAYCQLSFEL